MNLQTSRTPEPSPDESQDSHLGGLTPAPMTFRMDILLKVGEQGEWISECPQLGLVHVSHESDDAYDKMEQLCVEHLRHGVESDNVSVAFSVPDGNFVSELALGTLENVRTVEVGFMEPRIEFQRVRCRAA